MPNVCALVSFRLSVRVFRIVLWWRLRFCVVFILWTVCVSDQTRLSESKVRGKVMWISTSVPYFAPASAILKECIFFFFYKIISVCTWHLLPRGWCLGHCSGSSPLSPSWLAWKFKTIFLTSISAAKSLTIFLTVTAPNITRGYTDSSPHPGSTSSFISPTFEKLQFTPDLWTTCCSHVLNQTGTTKPAECLIHYIILIAKYFTQSLRELHWSWLN